MAKFHINKAGEAKPCRAKKRKCRFSGEMHFDSLDKAEKFAEFIAETYAKNEDNNTVKKKTVKKQAQKETADTTKQNYNKRLNITYRTNENNHNGYYNSRIVTGLVDYREIPQTHHTKLGFKDHEIIQQDMTIHEESYMSKSFAVMQSKREIELAKLTDKERKALYLFTKNDEYEYINHCLYQGFRKDSSGNSPDRVKNYMNRNDTAVRNIVSSLDNALLKASQNGLQRTLYRGVDADSVLFRRSSAKVWAQNNLLVGEEIVFPGFQSCSNSPVVGLDYARRGGLVYEIVTPEGLNISFTSDFPDEQETLLPRQSRFLVVSRDELNVHVSQKDEKNVGENVAQSSAQRDLTTITRSLPVTFVRLLALNSRGEILDGTNSDTREKFV